MSIFFDLVRSIGDSSFYKTMPGRSFVKAFAHIILIVFVYAIVFTTMANAKGVAPVLNFVEWAKESFPTATIAGNEMSTTVQEPYFVSYEPFEIDFIFSTQQNADTLDEIEPHSVIFEKTRMIYVDIDGEYDEYLYSDIENLPENINLLIDAALWDKIGGIIRGWAPPVIFIGILVFGVVMYMLSAFSVALCAALVNLFIKAPIGFKGIFMTAVYGFTLINLVAILSVYVPVLNFPGRQLLFILITLGYVIAGLVLVKKGSVDAA